MFHYILSLSRREHEGSCILYACNRCWSICLLETFAGVCYHFGLWNTRDLWVVIRQLPSSLRLYFLPGLIGNRHSLWMDIFVARYKHIVLLSFKEQGGVLGPLQGSIAMTFWLPIPWRCGQICIDLLAHLGRMVSCWLCNRCVRFKNSRLR